MKRLLLISAAALLISGAPAAVAQNGANPSVVERSTGATKATTGMAKHGARGGHAGHIASPIGGSNAAASNPQNSDEGRTSGGGGGSSGGGM